MGANVSHLCSCESNFKATEQNMFDATNRRIEEDENKQKHLREEKLESYLENSDRTNFNSNKPEKREVSLDDTYLNGNNRRSHRFTIGMTDAETSEMEHNLLFQSKTVVYSGDLYNGKKNGKGVLKTKTGSIIYEGSFKEDLFEGQGTYYYDNGLVYQGEFSGGKRNGYGVFFSLKDKFKYEGEWKDDLKWGQGVITYSDGIYKGSFSNDKKNGHGFIEGVDGSTYEGEFFDDKFHGEGKLVWPNNQSYQGQWKNNTIEGFGIFIKNGKIYIGNFLDDKKSGLGVFLLRNGNRLVGNFQDGEIEGLAIIFPNKGQEQLCYMTKSKPHEVITNPNQRNNIKYSVDYKLLLDFYNKNLDLVEHMCSNNNSEKQPMKIE